MVIGFPKVIFNSVSPTIIIGDRDKNLKLLLIVTDISKIKFRYGCFCCYTLYVNDCMCFVWEMGKCMREVDETKVK